MNIVFIGASRFGYRCLEHIISLPEITVTGIITNPATFSISYRPEGVKNVLHSDFHPLAKENNIPVWDMTGKMTDPALIEQVRQWEPDFILVVGWYHMIPKALRTMAPTAGLHASLLPDYSGGAPLVWAMINGESQTGISFFLMDEGVDSGPLIGQAVEPILEEDTIATLYARIEEAGIGLLASHLPKIARGEAQYTIQDESKRRLVPQRCPDDGLIDWQCTGKSLYNFIRAQTKPYPGAFTYMPGHTDRLTLWQALPPIQGIEGMDITPKPGLMVADNASRLYVGCGDLTWLPIVSLGWQEETYDSNTFKKQLMQTSTLQLCTQTPALVNA